MWALHYRLFDAGRPHQSAWGRNGSPGEQVAALARAKRENRPHPLIVAVMVARAEADPANWAWDIDQDGWPYFFEEV